MLSDGNVRYLTLAADMLQRCRIQTVNKFFLEKYALNCIFEYFRHYNNLLELGHEKMCLMSCVNKKGTDQPAHVHSLISAFVVRFLDSIISLDSIAEISRLNVASMAVQAGLCLAWSKTPEDTFCRVVAHLHFASNLS